MKTTNTKIAILALTLVAGLSITLRADTFGSGANTFTIDFVNVGNVSAMPAMRMTPGRAAASTLRPTVGCPTTIVWG